MLDDRDGTKARALAALIERLLPGWAIDHAVPHDRGCAELARVDGARVRIRVSPWGHAGRVVLTGVWPSFADGRYHHHADHPQVTCSVSRTDGEIAKAFLGRLLAAYGPAYAEAMAYVQREDERAAEARLVAAGIAHAAGGEVRQGREHLHDDTVRIHGTTPEAVSCLRVQPAYGSGEYARDVRVSFRVEGMAPEVAAEVLALIRAREQAALAPSAPARVATGAPAAHESDVDQGDEEPVQLRLAAELPSGVG